MPWQQAVRLIVLPSDSDRSFFSSPMTARAFALFVALLTIMNLMGDLLWPGFDASIWWISFGIVPAWLSKFLLAVSAFTLLVFVCRRPACGRRAPLTAALAIGLAGVSAINVVT